VILPTAGLIGGTITANSLPLSELRLAAASLREVGRIERTLFTIEWLPKPRFAPPVQAGVTCLFAEVSFLAMRESSYAQFR
jgi:hypothetical protein